MTGTRVSRFAVETAGVGKASSLHLNLSRTLEGAELLKVNPGAMRKPEPPRQTIEGRPPVPTVLRRRPKITPQGRISYAGADRTDGTW